MQEFYINKNSLNPSLRMEIIKDGRYDFTKFYEAAQDSVITFSMRNVDTGILKVSKQPAELLLSEVESCEEKYILSYKWKTRDVNEVGVFKGWFEIKFNGDIYQYGVSYPSGNLIVPIKDDLIISIR